MSSSVCDTGCISTLRLMLRSTQLSLRGWVQWNYAFMLLLPKLDGVIQVFGVRTNDHAALTTTTTVRANTTPSRSTDGKWIIFVRLFGIVNSLPTTPPSIMPEFCINSVRIRGMIIETPITFLFRWVPFRQCDQSSCKSTEHVNHRRVVAHYWRRKQQGKNTVVPKKLNANKYDDWYLRIPATRMIKQ